MGFIFIFLKQTGNTVFVAKGSLCLVLNQRRKLDENTIGKAGAAWNLSGLKHKKGNSQ